jgi:NADH-quinone oxidoreductase subunit E
MILGCHPGDCHYATGNYYAQNRAEVLAELLELAEVNPGRLILDWVSAGEGERFASLVSDFTARITALGPLGESEGLTPEELQDRLAALGRVVEGDRIRWLVGRKREILDSGNVYGEKVDPEGFDALLSSCLREEYLQSRLLVLTAKRALSVKEMAGMVGVIPQQVLPHVMALEQAGLMTMVGVENHSPRYRRA